MTLTDETNSNHEPRPAVRSDGATRQSADAAAQQRGEQNGLAGARLPATPAEDMPQEPVRRLNAAEIEPDHVSTDDEDAIRDDIDTAGQDDRPARFERRPFGSQLPKLSAPQRPGYRRYWFNDKPGRVARAKEAGYTVVEENGQPVCRVVNGGGMRAFLMEIPNRWFAEDMKAQQRTVDEIDKAIRAGSMKSDESSNRYVPKNAIGFRED